MLFIASIIVSPQLIGLNQIYGCPIYVISAGVCGIPNSFTASRSNRLLRSVKKKAIYCCHAIKHGYDSRFCHFVGCLINCHLSYFPLLLLSVLPRDDCAKNLHRSKRRNA